MNHSQYTGRPIRSLQTMLRTIARSENQPCSILPDGIYGQETTRAVSQFQQTHDLPVTGITDEATWDSLVRTYEDAQINVYPAQSLQIRMNCGETLMQSCTSHYIPLVQTMLSLLSETCGSIPAPGNSGILDEATAESLRCFQQLCGLPETGYVDKCTWKHLALQYELGTQR